MALWQKKNTCRGFPKVRDVFAVGAMNTVLFGILREEASDVQPAERKKVDQLLVMYRPGGSSDSYRESKLSMGDQQLMEEARGLKDLLGRCGVSAGDFHSGNIGRAADSRLVLRDMGSISLQSGRGRADVTDAELPTGAEVVTLDEWCIARTR